MQSQDINKNHSYHPVGTLEFVVIDILEPLLKTTKGNKFSIKRKTADEMDSDWKRTGKQSKTMFLDRSVFSYEIPSYSLFDNKHQFLGVSLRYIISLDWKRGWWPPITLKLGVCRGIQPDNRDNTLTLKGWACISLGSLYEAADLSVQFRDALHDRNTSFSAMLPWKPSFTAKFDKLYRLTGIPKDLSVHKTPHDMKRTLLVALQRWRKWLKDRPPKEAQ